MPAKTARVGARLALARGPVAGGVGHGLAVLLDRGGAGGHGTRGVIAVVRPPGAQPLVIAIYMDGKTHPLKTRDAAIAEIGEAVFAGYAR